MRVQTWAEFSAAVKRGATAGRLAGTVTSKQERKTRTGNKMGVVQFSDVSGQYEAVLFSEGLAQYRDHARARQIGGRSPSRPKTGRKASTCASRPWSRSSTWPARCRNRCAFSCATPARVGTLASQLAVKGEGQVSFVVIKEGGQGEVEIALPDRYSVSPRVASAMRAMPGVVEVELV